jgi:hypothetical protein
MSLETTLTTFVLFALLLLLLAWMSRQIGLLIQENVYRLTHSADLAMVILFIVYLPGILIHEASHWLMAKALGLKTGKFRVWPRKQGRQIGMGSVSVARGGTVADSAVGLAPLMIGSILVAMIGSQVFQTEQLGLIWQTGNWGAAFGRWQSALTTNPDGLLWSYLLFAVANAMLPSSSDREPLKSLLLYILIFGGVYLLVDRSGQFFFQLAVWLVPSIQILVSALLFIAILDIGVLALLFVLRTILIVVRPLPSPQRRRQKNEK